MIFATGIKKIYESIKKTEKGRAELFNSFQEKINESKILAHKFQILEAVRKNKGAFSKKQAEGFVASLKESHNKFLAENGNSVAMFYKEEKKLFEFFNVNQKELISEKLDLIVNKRENDLNESIILEYVTDPRAVTLQEIMEERKASLKEQYLNIKKTNDLEGLERQMKFMEFYATQFLGDRRKLVETSLKTIQNEMVKDFPSAVNKAYKLKSLCERLIMEYADEDEIEARGKVVKLPDLTHVKKISVEVPKGFATDTVTFNFIVPVYAVSPKLADFLVEIRKIKKSLYRLKTAFLRNAVEKSGGMLAIGNTLYDVTVAETNFKPGQPTFAKFEIVMAASDEINHKLATVDNYIKAAYSTLQAFDATLPTIVELEEILTPDVQLANLANAPEGRAKEYKRRDGEDKYYTDNRTHGGDEKFLDNTIIKGDAREPGVDDDLDPGRQDKEFYGDGDKNFNLTTDDDTVSDDEMDKIATAKALKNRRKPGSGFKKAA